MCQLLVIIAFRYAKQTKKCSKLQGRSLYREINPKEKWELEICKNRIRVKTLLCDLSLYYVKIHLFLAYFYNQIVFIILFISQSVQIRETALSLQANKLCILDNFTITLLTYILKSIQGRETSKMFKMMKEFNKLFVLARRK